MTGRRGPNVQRPLGVTGELGSLIGISLDRACSMITQVGNHGEIHDRNLGPDTGHHIPRGMNHSRVNGGLLHPPPIRRKAEPRTDPNQHRPNRIGTRMIRASRSLR